MEWTRTETLALAANSCTQCRGLGLKWGKKGGTKPCNCVLRSIFRACYARFRYCADKEKHMSRVRLEFSHGRERRQTWGRKDEEYIADFCLVSRRTLDEFEYKLFKFHFLLGADWRLCCRQLGLERGNFFHSLYRVEQKLGRVFRELEPYALFPLDEYFNGAVRSSAPTMPSPERSPALVVPIRGVRPAPICRAA